MSLEHVIFVNDVVRPDLLYEDLRCPPWIPISATPLQLLLRHVKPDLFVKKSNYAVIMECAKTLKDHTIHAMVVALGREAL
jgi:hypothetical protein